MDEIDNFRVMCVMTFNLMFVLFIGLAVVFVLVQAFKYRKAEQWEAGPLQRLERVLKRVTLVELVAVVFNILVMPTAQADGWQILSLWLSTALTFVWLLLVREKLVRLALEAEIGELQDKFFALSLEVEDSQVKQAFDYMIHTEGRA